MTYWMRPLNNHLELGATDGPIDNPYPEASYAGRMWRAGNAFHHGSPDDSFAAMADARKIITDLENTLPSIDELASKSQIPLEKWPGNCAKIAAAVLPHLSIPHALTAYGFYTGEVSSKSRFAGATIIRHGWIETLNGLVIDPTHWVFEATEPKLYVGSIADFDFGMMRYKAETPFPEPATKMFEVEFGKDQVAFIEQLTGLTATNNRFRLAYNQASWLADRPMQVMREHFCAVIDALDASGIGWITEDTRNWRDANHPTINDQAAAAA